MNQKELKAKWSKRENDFMIYFPIKRDGGMLQGFLMHDKNINGKTFLQELEERGYDKTTLKISVRLK